MACLMLKIIIPTAVFLSKISFEMKFNSGHKIKTCHFETVTFSGCYRRDNFVLVTNIIFPQYWDRSSREVSVVPDQTS